MLEQSLQEHRELLQQKTETIDRLMKQQGNLKLMRDELQLALTSQVETRQQAATELEKCRENWVTMDPLEVARREAEIGWVLKDPISKTLRMKWNPCLPFDCNRDEVKCNNNNPTDFSGKAGDNKTAPCCTHLMRDLLVEIKTILDGTQKDWFIHYGTLLGAVRTGNIIPWTADVDVAISKEAWEYLQNPDVKRLIWNKGFNYFEDTDRYGAMGRLCFAKHWHNGILTKWPKVLPTTGKNSAYYDHVVGYLDMYFITTPRSPMFQQLYVETSRGPCPFLKEWIWPIGRMDLFNTSFPVPAKPKTMVIQIYGEGWADPQKAMHGEGGHKCFYTAPKKRPNVPAKN